MGRLADTNMTIDPASDKESFHSECRESRAAYSKLASIWIELSADIL